MSIVMSVRSVVFIVDSVFGLNGREELEWESVG